MMPGFLTREYAHIPMWGWIMGGVAGLVIFQSMKSKSSAATTANSQQQMSGNNGNQPSPSIFFLPQGPYPAPATPGNISVVVNPRDPNSPPPPDVVPVPASDAAQDAAAAAAAAAAAPPPAPAPQPAPTPQPRAVVSVEKWPGRSENGLAQWDTTLWGIARHFGTSVDKLASDNNISNPNLIYPGQQITVW